MEYLKTPGKHRTINQVGKAIRETKAAEEYRNELQEFKKSKRRINDVR
jgi:UDP-N-acetylmuramate-alanine ligase